VCVVSRFAPAKRTSRACEGLLPKLVIPAQAGIQYAPDAQEVRWMPAFAGMTDSKAFRQQPREEAALAEHRPSPCIHALWLCRVAMPSRQA